MKTTQPPAAGADARAREVLLREVGKNRLTAFGEANVVRAMLAFASQEAAHVAEHLAVANAEPGEVCPDCGGQGIDTDTLGVATRACGKCGGAGRIDATPVTTSARWEELREARYLSDRFQWAAPGDRQEDAWLVRFCDNDVRDMIFTGPDAEQEAWAAWERHAPGYNMYVFRLAALANPPASQVPGREDAALRTILNTATAKVRTRADMQIALSLIASVAGKALSQARGDVAGEGLRS